MKMYRCTGTVAFTDGAPMKFILLGGIYTIIAGTALLKLIFWSYL